jgi:hypothetical protein
MGFKKRAIMGTMNRPAWQNERVGLWLAPFFSTLLLVPLFGLRGSPFFLGRRIDQPSHPMNWPVWGPWLSSMAVVFDGTRLAYFVACLVVLPVYWLYHENRAVSFAGVLAIFGSGGIAASQLVHLLQGFRQADLRAFAKSWWSPLIGCVCGLVAGACFAALARRPLSRATKTFLYPLPVAAVVVCAVALLAAAKAWRGN